MKCWWSHTAAVLTAEVIQQLIIYLLITIY